MEIVKEIVTFLRKEKYGVAYYIIDYSSLEYKAIYNQIFFIQALNCIKKLAKIDLFEIYKDNDIAKHFTTDVNEIFSTNGITIYITKIEKDTNKEIEKLQNLKEKILAKLSNPNFNLKAPRNIIEKEKNSLIDIENKIKLLSKNDN